MDILKQTLEVSNNTIKLLLYQQEQIDNIEQNNKIIKEKINQSTELLKKVTNFFYRLTYYKNISKEQEEHIQENDKVINIFEEKEMNDINVLKKNNMIIENILDNQNEKLKKIKNYTDKNTLNLNTLSKMN